MGCISFNAFSHRLETAKHNHETASKERVNMELRMKAEIENVRVLMIDCYVNYTCIV